MKIVFATRPSLLARTQTQAVIHALQLAHPGLDCEEKIITTRGDVILDRPLPEIGGKGLFTEALENELLYGAVHCAVHSLKDLPIQNPDGLMIGCIPARVDARDVLVSAHGYTLSTLPAGACVGTSSLRRAAQALAQRPDLQIQSLRGNVDTRLRKAAEGAYEAILLAGAGLIRLGLERHATEWLPLDAMLPAPGQGALVVQCRADDAVTLELLGPLEHPATRRAVMAERSFLLGLGGGCTAPVAAYAVVDNGASQTIRLQGRVISPDGKQVMDLAGEGPDAPVLGKGLAGRALRQGAQKILVMAIKGSE